MQKTQYPLRENRKQKIRSDFLLAATDLFAERGYEQTTLTAVADQAGILTPIDFEPACYSNGNFKSQRNPEGIFRSLLGI